MTKKDVKIYIGNTAETTRNNITPCGISSFTPYIMWEIPNDVVQVRFNIKITNLSSGSYLIAAETIGEQKYFQWPLGLSMNESWLGLCHVEIVFSDNNKIGTPMDYTSGDTTDSESGFFVLDNNLEILSSKSPISYLWEKSFDQNTSQNLFYHLQVSQDPLFRQDSTIINDTNISGVTSGYVVYNGYKLEDGYYFYRVRAYDGYDYSDWSIINSFCVKSVEPPVLKNLSAYDTENEYGDFIINFDLENNGSQYTTVILQYARENDILNRKPCSLINSTHLLKSGNNNIVWRTSEDIIKEKGRFWIYATPYSNEMYGDEKMVLVYINNERFNQGNSGVSSITISFINSYYMVYKRESSTVIENNPLIYQMSSKISSIEYIGWNSDLWSQIQNDSSLIDYLKTEDYQYYVNYLKLYPKQPNKYNIENTKFSEIEYKDIKDFSIYLDGRSFLQNDIGDYIVANSSDSVDKNEIILGGSVGKFNMANVTIRPSYQKPPSFNPKFVESSPDVKTNENIVNPQYSAYNFAAYNTDDDGIQRLYYYYRWGGELKGQFGSYSEEQEIENGFGKRKFVDGECVFEDNETESPEYTMYPHITCKNGYPPFIDQRYWDVIDLNDLYIRKYFFEKGHKNAGTNGYKNFTTQKIEGLYHRTFSNKTIPDEIIIKNEKIYDKQDNVLYINNEKTTNLFSDLPNKIFFVGENILDELNEEIYFQSYERKHTDIRGEKPQIISGENEEIEMTGLGFSNVAVPQYVKANTVVSSSNSFNGKKSAFYLDTQITRDKRRYVLGHYYDWKNRLLDENILSKLNAWFNQNYPNYNFKENSTRIFNYKYKYIEDGTIKSKEYIYIPFENNGNVECFWFEDETGIFNIDWSSIDNDDYISIVRDNISPYIFGSERILTNAEYDVISEGGVIKYDLLKKQSYLSDKSSYGISDFTVFGDISDYIYEYYQNYSETEFISTPKTIFLDHKNVIKESLSLYYYSENSKIVIDKSDYYFTQGNTGYNASIVLYQKEKYYNKKIYFEYRYYIDSETNEEYFSSTKPLIFSYPDEKIAIEKNSIVQNDFVFLDGADQIGKRYYDITETNYFSFVKLNYYILNRNIVVSYDYLPESEYLEKTFVFDNEFKYQIDIDAVPESIDSYYIDDVNYYKLINSYVLSDNKITLNLNESSSYEAIDKPIKINYNIEETFSATDTINFNNVYGNIFDNKVNISTINIFYFNQAGERQVLDSSLYRITINDIEIDYLDPQYENSFFGNVKIELKQNNDYIIQNILINKLYVEYNNEQSLNVQDFMFNISKVYIGDKNFVSYDLKQNGFVLPKSYYNFENGFIELKTSDGIYKLSEILFVDLDFSYTYKVNRAITKTTEDFSFQFDDINQEIQLEKDITEDIYFYQINDQHEITPVSENMFELNKDTGIIKLSSTSSELVGKKIIIDYSYNTYETLTVNKEIIFTNENQEIYLDNNIFGNIGSYSIEQKNFVYSFVDENDEFIYEDINVYDFELSYELGDIEVFLESSDFYIDELNRTIVIENSNLFNNDIKIYYKIKTVLFMNNFVLDQNKIKLSSTGISNGLLNKNIYIYYSYLNFKEILKNKNLLFNTYNSYSFTLEDKVFEDLEVYFADIKNNINNFCEFDPITGNLFVKDEDFKSIISSKTVYSKYKKYLDSIPSSEIIKFSNVFERINLNKKNIILNTLSYSFETDVENEIYNLVSSQDFVVASNSTTSYINLSNRYLNKELNLNYKYYVSENNEDIFESNTNQTILLTKYPVDRSSVVVSYLAFNDKYYIVPIDRYDVLDDGEKTTINFTSNFSIYSGKTLKIKYDYRSKSEIINQNFKREYIVFYDTSSLYQIQKENVISDSVKVYTLNQNNTYEEIDLKYFNFSFGTNTTIRLNKNQAINFILNKPIKIEYKYKNISELNEYNFTNNMDLTFSNLTKPIILSNSYIIEDTFEIYYYDSNNERKPLSKDFYYLWTGNDFSYGNVRLNGQNNESKNIVGKRLEIKYKYLNNVKKIYGSKNEKFPDIDFSSIYYNNQDIKEYYSAYPHSEHIGYSMRKDAVWDGDRGIGLNFSIVDSYEFLELKFIYLQRFWDAYNTIHWDGNLGENTKIHLQYGIVNSRGVVEEKDWHDVITSKSEFNNELYLNLIPPFTWSVFIDTFDESVFIQNVTYMFRLRLYDETTKTFTSEFINSGKFVIDHDAVNPANITNVSYNAWTKRLSIEFRIDDTQGDLYDITSIYYSEDGRTWNSIDINDVSGKTTYLKSNLINEKDITFHKIFWDTSNYNLYSGTNYRIKIEATYTKFNQGDEPYFNWICTKNPEIDHYERKILQIEGGKQYYYYNDNRFSEIKNEDGTIEYVESDNPVGTWERVKPYEYTYQIQKIDGNGDPVTETIVETRDYTVINGIIKDKENEIQKIKDRPYKTIVNNGSISSVAWGTKEYYNEFGVLTNKTGYNNWLNGYDEVYGAKRIDLISSLNNEIDLAKTNLLLYKKKLLECEIENRRSLVKQGFYSNGFENNSYDENNPVPYQFKVIDSPSAGSVNDADLSQEKTDLYTIYYNFQMDFYSNYNSQPLNTPLRNEFFTYNQNSDSIERIKAGKSVSNASHVKVDGETYSNTDPSGTPQNSDNRYYGDYNMSPNKYPGKLSADTLPSSIPDWTYEYFWRFRPYNIFTQTKREVSRSLISSISKDGQNLKINFYGIGKEELGNVYLQDNGIGYVVYLSTEKNETIKLSNPTINDMGNSNYSGYVVAFHTDRLRDSDGYVIDNDNFKNWTSFNPNKTRPICVIFNNDYYLYYYKPSIFNNKLIYCSTSKNGQDFGEYAQCYPYNPDEIITDFCNYSQLLDPFVIRSSDSFSMWTSATEKTDFDGNKNVVCFQKSDYSGDVWTKPVTCNGLENCFYPSITYEEKQREVIKNGKNVIENYNYYILCAQKNQTFSFFYSEGDEKNWNSYNLILNKENLKLKNFSYSYDNINYGTPFLHCETTNGLKKYYLYFSVYDNLGNSDIYRTTSNDLEVWEDAELIIQNGFNPSVVIDSYFGNKTQRLYYNATVDSKINGQTVKKIIVKTLIITKMRSWEQFNVIASSCNLEEIPTSNNGILNNISIKPEGIESLVIENIEARVVFAPLNNTRQYYRYGNWLNFENAETFGCVVNPENRFKYLNV